MEGLTEHSNRLALFCLCCMIANGIKAQGLSAEQLLSQKEQDLNMIVQAIEKNARNCSALVGCSGSDGGCSRLTCYKYGTQGDENHQCLDVDSNADCGSDCKERNFDFTRTYLRRMDTLDSNIARTVCTHRNLDAILFDNNISNKSHRFGVFFGSVDGTTRIYPGLDEKCDTVYDPRLRPWYLKSTYVPKAVTVLIDSGTGMRAALAGGKNDETSISKAKNMTIEFLKTLKDVQTWEDSEDFISIACFDGDGYIPLKNDVPTKYNSTNFLDKSFNDSLAAIINNGSVMTNPDAVDTTNAINTAISRLNSNFDSATHLKVVIVITTGKQFKSLADLNITANSGVAVFVFNYFRFEGRLPHCSNSSSIQAYSDEILSERLDNSLYALHPYYSFTAKIHKEFRDRTQILADYGTQAKDFSGVDNSSLTLSKAAFGPSGELLGVVGIDFYQRTVEKQYNIQFQAIVIAARDRPIITYQLSNLSLNVCFNHTDDCPSLDTNVQFLCGVKTGDPNIGCCGKCKKKKTEWGKIVGGTGAGVGVIVILAIVMHAWRNNIATRKHIKPFPGDTQDPGHL